MMRAWAVGVLLLASCPSWAEAQQRPAPRSEPKPDPMTFEIVTNDPDAQREKQARWISARGSIMPDTGKVFEEFLRKNPISGLTIYFDSPGGSIVGGIELGEKLRAAEAKVAVGRSVPFSGPTAEGKLPRHQLAPNSGQCNSSCSYAFLGGVSRSINSDAFFGVHMFWSGNRIEQLYQQTYTAADVERAQRISARLAVYIQKMGVHLGMLEIASTVPHRAPIRRLTNREIADLRIASIEYGAPIVASPGNWGLVTSATNARLITGGNTSGPGRPDVRYQLELSCNGTPGFHDARFELSLAKAVENGRAIAMRRVLMVSGRQDAVIAFSGKDIRAMPPPFTRLTASRPGGWIAKGGTVVSSVIENAVQRPADGLKIIIEEGDGEKSEVRVEIGNLSKHYRAWTSACEKIRSPE